MPFNNECNYAYTKTNKRNKKLSAKATGEITEINLKCKKSETECH